MDYRSKVTYFIIALGVFATGVSAYFYITSDYKNKNIKSFADCTNSGYKILNSYPAQCRTSNGKTFTEEIGNSLEKSNLITLKSPLPNAKVSLPLKLKGMARGSWFFEGSFPIKLIGEGGFLISQGNAQAVGDWMSQDFVPFTAELTGALPEGGKGMLILEKSNPSDLPENADQLQVPIQF